jgi:hypothetical protein
LTVSGTPLTNGVLLCAQAQLAHTANTPTRISIRISLPPRKENPCKDDTLRACKDDTFRV